MKILTIISLLASLYSGNSKPIVMNFTKTGTNNTGNTSYNGLLSASFWYTCEDWGYETEISAPQLLGITSVYPQTFILNINLQFKQPVEYAQVSIELPNPRTTNGHADYNFIGDYCKLQSNFTNTIYCEVYNTSLVAIKIIYSAEQLDEYYGITRNLITSTDPDENYWVTNGDLHCNVQGLNLTSCTLSEGIDYYSQLGSLLAYTDGIEGLLQSIVSNTSTIASNTSYLSTISSNISSIQSTINTINTRLNNIYNNLNYLFKDEQVYQGLTNSLKYRVDNIGEVLEHDILSIYAGDYIGGTGPSTPAQYITLWDDVNHINDEYDKTKLKLVFCLYSTADTQYYYVNVPILKSNTNGDNGSYTFAETLYVLQNNTTIIRITAQFRITEHYIGYWLAIGQYSLSTGGLTTGSISSSVYRTILTDASLSEINKLDDIIEAINNLSSAFDDITIDTTNKSTVDAFFEELKQSLTLPSIPQSFNDTVFEKMGILLKPYISMVINFPLYKNILMIASLFTVLGVILL